MPYVNLMSRAAQVREIRRTRIRQWSTVLLAAMALLLAATIVAWWPVYRETRRVAALEMQYEPTRQLIAETKRLRRQVDQTRRRGRLALALERQMPLLTLLGRVGQAVAETEERVALASLAFEQAPGPWAQPDSTTLKLSGLGESDQATADLADALRDRLAVAVVDVQDSRPVTRHGEVRSEFTIHAALP